ncbi:hypothetical protein MWH28_06660 [Natroniella sulfidigena]|uniref:hypothetical protein n=1 Tax=Natroniella sulfidigena TaxID=723921 RepID=UPI00200B59C0|nr:hypothetical protein [Natroniella sulfidigena]MCK8817053.1 hypothetical protein [Natroniella sulfidigena]
MNRLNSDSEKEETSNLLSTLVSLGNILTEMEENDEQMREYKQEVTSETISYGFGLKVGILAEQDDGEEAESDE